jgi:hypothetical protein
VARYNQRHGIRGAGPTDGPRALVALRAGDVLVGPGRASGWLEVTIPGAESRPRNVEEFRASHSASEVVEDPGSMDPALLP